MLDLSSVIQQRDHEPIITAAVFGNANATKKRWEEEGKNVEEEIQKQKERDK